jgi:hypothetical protein
MGFNVQLQHLQESTAGFVSLKTNSGEVLAQSNDYQQRHSPPSVLVNNIPAATDPCYK